MERSSEQRRNQLSSFGSYQVGDKVGSGGMAVVHRARQVGILGFDRTVALKRLLPSVSSRPEVIEMFVREATLASKLRHPNIVQIYELGVVDRTYFISMEFVDGWSLSEVLKKVRRAQATIPIEVSLALLTQLAEALHYAHGATDEHGRVLGLVHGDISPANVLISRTGHVKVIDFGIARAARSRPDDSGVIKGKFGYLAPEILYGGEPSPVSDIFAAGVVAHELVTSERLFGGRDDRHTVDNILRLEPTAPSQRNFECPPELDQVIIQALARDPHRRTQSGAHLRDALEIVRRRHRINATHVDIASWLNSAMTHGRVRAQGTQGPWVGDPDSASVSSSSVQTIDYADVEISVTGEATKRSRSTKLAMILAALSLSAVAAGFVASRLLTSRGAAPAAVATTADARASVNINVDPPDAVVRIAGRGALNAGSVELEPGIYSVAVERQGYQTWVSTVELDSGETKAISIALVKLNAATRGPRISLKSKRSSYRISVDGVLRDERTPAEFTVEPGAHRIALLDGDDVVWRKSVDAEDGHLYQFEADVRDRDSERSAARAERRRERARASNTPSASMPKSADSADKDDTDDTDSAPAVASRPPLTLGADLLSDLSDPPPAAAPLKPTHAPGAKRRPTTILHRDVTKISGSIPTIRQALIDQAGSSRTGAVLVCISTSGRVRSARALNKKLPSAINKTMVAAVKKWRYQPYRANGTATPACFSVVFGLRSAEGR